MPLYWIYLNTSADESVDLDSDARNRCIAKFSETFALPFQNAERLFTDFAGRADTVRPVMIGIEGLDGSGKTAQAKKICQIPGIYG